MIQRVYRELAAMQNNKAFAFITSLRNEPAFLPIGCTRRQTPHHRRSCPWSWAAMV